MVLHCCHERQDLCITQQAKPKCFMIVQKSWKTARVWRKSVCLHTVMLLGAVACVYQQGAEFNPKRGLHPGMMESRLKEPDCNKGIHQKNKEGTFQSKLWQDHHEKCFFYPNPCLWTKNLEDSESKMCSFWHVLHVTAVWRARVIPVSDNRPDLFGDKEKSAESGAPWGTASGSDKWCNVYNGKRLWHI